MQTGAAYIRVSTDDQLEYSPDAQLREIKKRAAADKVIIPTEFIFIDEGISGRNTKKRDDFNRMIGIAKSTPKPFNVIYVWKFSRFARNQEESIVYKSLLRNKLGIDVTSVSEPLIEGPFGSLIERIIEWMDEYYSIRLAGEVVRGMTEKAHRGEFQSSPAFGYTKLPGQPLQILEAEAKYVRYIFESYVNGATLFSLSRELNTIGVTTKRGNAIENRMVEYIINNPIYAGFVRWTPTGKAVGKRIYNCADTITVKSNHKPIISEELFSAAQKRYWEENAKRKLKERPAETKKHYLSGILKCSSCGSTLGYTGVSNGFQCISYSKGTCKTSHYISSNKIVTSFLEGLDQILASGSFIKNVRKIKQNDDAHIFLDGELKKLNTMLVRAKQAFLAEIDTVEEYRANKTQIQKEIKSCKDKISKLKEPEVDMEAVKDSVRTLKEVLLSDVSTTQKSKAVHEIIEKVIFYKDKNEIEIFLYQ